MISAYYFLYGTLGVLLAAYIPGIIAAEKEHRFSRWYVYGVLLLPVAFIHSLLLKKPIHRINIFTHDANDPLKRKKKTYTLLPREKRRFYISPKYIYAVFFSKLLFSAFVAFSVFAIFRTIVHGTETLVQACAVFAVIFAVMLSIVELCRLSKLPRIADEITKRALMIMACSVICSLPLYLVKTYIADPLFSGKHTELIMFLFTLTSFGVFLWLLLGRQRIFYSAFNNFTDYTILSMCAYAIFAAISLIWMSTADLREFILIGAMPTQVFNTEYLSAVKGIDQLSSIYSSAMLHLLMEGIILISGLLCRRFKIKEMEFRVEYRSKAFRMSRKRVLHKRITYR